MRLNKLKSRIAFLLIGILFVAGLAAGFHHHDDNILRHDDCSVCATALHSPAITTGIAGLPVYNNATFLEVISKSLDLPRLVKAGSGTRAPPL